MGYNPKMWGRQAWHFIHMVALSMPDFATEEQKKTYYEFFQSLGETLPCGTCAQNYKKKFDENPPRLGSKKELFRWTVDIHNAVNKENGKKQFSYDEALEAVNKNSRLSDINVGDIVMGVSLSVSVITMISLFAYSIRKK